MSATWVGVTSDFDTNENWNPATVPSDAAIFADAGMSAVTFSQSTDIGEFDFLAGAQAYTIASDGSAGFELTGAGIVNDSDNIPVLSATDGGFIQFANSADAGDAILQAGGWFGTSSLEFLGAATATNAEVQLTSGGVLAVGTSASLPLGSLFGTANTTVEFFNSSAPTLTVGSLNTSTTFAGVIDENAPAVGSLVKVGTGTLTLSGANSFTGGATISAGTLAVANNSALGGGAVTLASGATLALEGFVISNPVDVLGAATISVTGANAIGALAGTGPLTIVGTLGSATNDVLTLTAAGSYGASLFVGDGTSADAVTLKAGAASAFSENSATSVTANSVLDLDGLDETINSLSGAGAVTNSSATAATLTVQGGSFGGAISGNIGLVVDGGFTLSGANPNFSGFVSIDDAILTLANANALPAVQNIELQGSAPGDAASATLAAAVSVDIASLLLLLGHSRVEAATGQTLQLSDFDATQSAQPYTLYVGSAADEGMVTLGASGGGGFASGQQIEIDGGALDVQSNLSLSGVAVTFAGTSGKLILNSTSSAVDVSSGAGASGEVDLNAAQVDFTGGGESVKFLSGADDAATLAATDGAWDTVTGSGGVVTLEGAQASVLGGGDVINLQGGLPDSASLYDTGNDWDAVYGSSGTVTLNGADASIIGGGDTIYLAANTVNAVSLYGANNNWDAVYGVGQTVIASSAEASVIGGGDTLYLNGSSSVSLSGTNGNWDAVDGVGQTLILDSAQAGVVGGGDTLYLNGSSSVSLSGTDGNPDAVFGVGQTLIASSAQATVVGGGDVLYLNGASSVSLTATNGDWDAVYGNGQSEILDSAEATLIGNGDTVYLSGDNAFTLSGSADSLVTRRTIGEDWITGFGASDTIQFNTADFANFAALQSHMTQSSPNTLITLDANDEITLYDVQASSLMPSQFKFV